VFTGHRRLLPIGHCLRYTGQSKMCCPSTYYDEDDQELDEEFCGKPPFTMSTIPKNLKSCDTKVSNLNLVPSEKRLWYHDNYDFKSFQGHLYYKHLDLRSQDAIRKREDEFYLDNGNRALTSKNKKAVNGVQGLWYFIFLIYASIKTDVCWDAMHIMKNWCHYLLEIILGERFFPTEYCRQCGTHPLMTKEPKAAPWLLSKMEKDLVNAFLLCIIIPIKHRDTFRIERIIKEDGKKNPYIKTVDCINLLTVLFPFILSQTNLPLAYKNFFYMLSEDFSELLNVEVDPSDLDGLFDEKLPETLSTKEGLFTDAEGLIVYHQILDLKSHIVQFGPLRNSWAFSGERALSTIKETSKKFHESRTLSSQNKSENLDIASKYKFDFLSFDQKLERNRFMEFIDNNLVYNETKTQLIGNVIESNLILDTFEVNELLKAIIVEIFMKSDYTFKIAYNYSALFRLFSSYQGYLNIKGNLPTEELTFLEYLCKLVALKDEMLENDDGLSELLQKYTTEENRINLGHYTMIDIVNLNKKIETLLNPQCYKKCIVHGIEMTSRRPECRENKPAVIFECRNWGRQRSSRERMQPYKNSNPVNDLNENWQNDLDASSWAKLRILLSYENLVNYVTKKVTHLDQESLAFGQCNFFFSLDLSDLGEKLLKNIVFASVTARKPYVHKAIKHHFIVYAKPEYLDNGTVRFSYDPKVSFIPVDNFFSTAVAICGFDKDFKPFVNDKLNHLEKKQVSNKDTNELYYLHLLDLHPSRKNIRRM
jgi:hypothetical protein